MNRHVLFIQGGGDGGYESDEKLVASLQKELGAAYQVHYPQMPSNEDLPDFGWLQQIGDEIATMNDDVILVGHSLGASMLLRYFSEKKITKKIAGIFLIATPFWTGNEDWKKGLKLKANFAEKLSKEIPTFFYQCHDDEVVAFSDLDIYRQKLPWATFREISYGGHQFNNDLTLVAQDIKSL